MSIQFGIVMDPIAHIKPYKDTSLAMLLAAQRHGWILWYMELSDLYLENGEAYATMYPITVEDSTTHWYELGEAEVKKLASLDTVFMRKDPPFDLEFIAATYLLEQAEAAGTLVVNKPQSLRDANEKLFTAWFPQCCVPNIVTRRQQHLREFIATHKDVIIKPIDSMGGDSIYRVREGDVNTSVIIENMTFHEQRFIMAQKYIPEIVKGDKRILLINGKPVPYALARIPAEGETRGNIAAGGRGEPVPLTERDYWLCEQVGQTLRDKGLYFVGLDVIGDYLTEINVTSPTCIRELDKAYNLDIAGELMDMVAEKL